MQIRRYQPADAGALAQIFFDAVRLGAAPKYTAAELAAWAPERPSAAAWAQRLDGLTTVVAESPSGLLGFMSLRSDGYLDLAFVRPDCRGTGVAAALHSEILTEACARHLHRLTTEASRMARPFFLRMGWHLIAAQTVQRNGQSIENFRMAKSLKISAEKQPAVNPMSPLIRNHSDRLG